MSKVKFRFPDGTIYEFEGYEGDSDFIESMGVDDDDVIYIVEETFTKEMFEDANNKYLKYRTLRNMIDSIKEKKKLYKFEEIREHCYDFEINGLVLDYIKIIEPSEQKDLRKKVLSGCCFLSGSNCFFDFYIYFRGIMDEHHSDSEPIILHLVNLVSKSGTFQDFKWFLEFLDGAPLNIAICNALISGGGKVIEGILKERSIFDLNDPKLLSIFRMDDTKDLYMHLINKSFETANRNLIEILYSIDIPTELRIEYRENLSRIINLSFRYGLPNNGNNAVEYMSWVFYDFREFYRENIPAIITEILIEKNNDLMRWLCLQKGLYPFRDRPERRIVGIAWWNFSNKEIEWLIDEQIINVPSSFLNQLDYEDQIELFCNKLPEICREYIYNNPDCKKRKIFEKYLFP